MLIKAVVDLHALRRNARAVKRKLNGKAKLCAVVKADAYGHGGAVCASALYNVADCFAVATVEEGKTLRISGIDKDILILVPVSENEIADAINENLVISCDGISLLRKIKKTAERIKRTARIHFIFNSGMNRFGADLNELEKMFRYARGKKTLSVEGLFSHYANPSDDISRNEARSRFLLAISLGKRYNNKIICHISASGGFIEGDYFDMVRVGILLYGYKPFPADGICVKPVMKVYAPVIRERSVKSGEGALYGLKKAEKDTDFSIVLYGYASGLPRAEISGQFNNRCMDVTAVRAKRGRKILPVMTDADALAKEYGTISYEVLTKVALKAEKIYLR